MVKNRQYKSFRLAQFCYPTIELIFLTLSVDFFLQSDLIVVLPTLPAAVIDGQGLTFVRRLTKYFIQTYTIP